METAGWPCCMLHRIHAVATDRLQHRSENVQVAGAGEANMRAALRRNGSGRAVEKVNRQDRCPPNGPEVNLRGQGPRAEASAARRMPALEARDAGGVTPLKYR
jgi:hypothetical protein